MNIKDFQEKLKQSKSPFNNPAEIMLAVTEELGEAAQEVALLEKIGTKVDWQKEPSIERLGVEIGNLLNCIFALANHYDIDVEEVLKK